MASSRSCLLQTIQSTLADIDVTQNMSLQQAEAIEWRVELVYRDLLAKELCGELDVTEQTALPLIANAYSCLREVIDTLQQVFTAHDCPQFYF